MFDSFEVAFHDVPLGRMRSRAIGRSVAGVPELVLAQGMAVADHLLPGVAALGGFTRAHLLELPGLSGSGDPPYELDVPGYGQAVAQWLDAAVAGAVVLAGHSSGPRSPLMPPSGARAGWPRWCWRAPPWIPWPTGG